MTAPSDNGATGAPGNRPPAQVSAPTADQAATVKAERRSARPPRAPLDRPVADGWRTGVAEDGSDPVRPAPGLAAVGHEGTSERKGPKRVGGTAGAGREHYGRIVWAPISLRWRRRAALSTNRAQGEAEHDGPRSTLRPRTAPRRRPPLVVPPRRPRRSSTRLRRRGGDAWGLLHDERVVVQPLACDFYFGGAPAGHGSAIPSWPPADEERERIEETNAAACAEADAAWRNNELARDDWLAGVALPKDVQRVYQCSISLLESEDYLALMKSPTPRALTRRWHPHARAGL